MGPFFRGLMCFGLLASLAGCGGAREPLRLSSAGTVRSHGEAEPEPAGLVEEDLTPRAWLFEVRGPGGIGPSYLLGTMHIGVTFRTAVPAPLDSALFDARLVAMEIDMRDAMRFFREAPRSTLPRRAWLDRALPRETWQRLSTELARLAPAEIVRQVHPGALTNYLAQVRMAEVEALEDGRTPIAGAISSTRLDRSIFDWTIRSGVPFVALETPEEAMAALSALDRGDAVEALVRMVDDADEARLEARQLRDAYRSLDEEAVLAVLSSMSAADHAILLEQRNAAWMPHVLPELARGGVFVAVGVAHLLGPASVVELLRAEGYTVERVLGDGGMRPTERTDVIMGRLELSAPEIEHVARLTTTETVGP
jgi:hypothetical protein